MFRASMSHSMGAAIIAAAFFAAGAVLFAPSDAAACSMHYVDLFTQAEQAATVAIGTVDGEGGIRVERRLRGAGGDTVPVANWEGDPSRWTSCVPRTPEGRRILIFLDGENRLVAHFQSTLRLDERAANRRAKTEALSKWMGAENGSQRLEVLVEIAAGDDADLAKEAGRHLVDRVEWFDQISDEQIRALREGLAGHDRPIYALGWLLLRLGDEESADVLEGFLGTSPTIYRSSLGLDLFERRPDDEADRDELVTIIENGPEMLDRVAALEACEREVGRSLYPFAWYRRGMAEHVWPRLAEACKTGEPKAQR